MLIAQLRIEQRHIGMQTVAQNVQMSAQLIVPAFLRLIGDGIFYVGIVLLGVRHVVVASLRFLLSFFARKVGIQDVGEQLNVISSCHIALAHGSIDVASVVAQLIAEPYFGKELSERSVIIVGEF